VTDQQFMFYLGQVINILGVLNLIVLLATRPAAPPDAKRA
jgi:hypothetical protein